MVKLSMSRTKYIYGWTDPRVFFGSGATPAAMYRYEVRYSFNPKGYEVVKKNIFMNEVVEVLASGLKRDAAEGFIKILKEN